METKHPLASKTLWTNVLALIASVSGMFAVDLGLTHEAQASIVGGVLAVVNIGLRLVTKSAVTVRK